LDFTLISDILWRRLVLGHCSTYRSRRDGHIHEGWTDWDWYQTCQEENCLRYV